MADRGRSLARKTLLLVFAAVLGTWMFILGFFAGSELELDDIGLRLGGLVRPIGSAAQAEESDEVDAVGRKGLVAEERLEVPLATGSVEVAEKVADELVFASSAAEKISSLEGLVEKLNSELAEARVQAKENQRRLDELTRFSPVGSLSPKTAENGEWVLVDVNQPRGLVAMGAGSLDGVRSGLICLVLRDGRVAGRCKVLEVRERIAALSVEETFVEGFLKIGDRVIPDDTGAGG